MKSVTAKWAKENVDKINLIDVRTPGEYAAYHIEGSKNIPLTGLIFNPQEFINKDEEYYIMCQGGVRSVHTINSLEEKGYTNLINVEGGIEAA